MDKLPEEISIRTEGENQIVCVTNKHAYAEVSSFGAHVLSYKPGSDKQERIWLSSLAKIDGTEAIRGGVPVCWPWFSNQFPSNEPGLPSHGYCRTSYWQLDNAVTNDNNETTVKFVMSVSQLPGFPYYCELGLYVEVGQQLKISLYVTNKDEKDIEITGALHSYFSVDKVSDIEIQGLSGEYKDKTQGFATSKLHGPYNIVGETDNIHLCSPDQLTLINNNVSSALRKSTIKMSGHDSVVVWNPGQAGAASIANMPDDGWQNFICIEAAITSPYRLPPGKEWRLVQSID